MKLNAKVLKIEDGKISYKQRRTENTTSESITTSSDFEEVLYFGLCVWAAGTAPREITQLIANRIDAVPALSLASLPAEVATDDDTRSLISSTMKKTGRLPLDRWMRICLCENARQQIDPNSILAMGDCALIVRSSCTQPFHYSLYFSGLPLFSSVSSELIHN